VSASNWELYKRQPGFVLGFHGCDETVGEAILAGKSPGLKQSVNDYDWLGSGIYFWEGNPARAFQFADDAVERNKKTTKGTIKKPFVLGAIIDLGYCFNLLETDSLIELKTTYTLLSTAWDAAGVSKPENKHGPDKLGRYLDQSVIESMHEMRTRSALAAYDTVRAAFSEGSPLYDGAVLTEKAHIQIAVRNVDCIRGYFRPIPTKKSAA